MFAHIAWDRISIKPGVESIRDNEVRFTDGTSETYDVMIAATGYEIDLPFLSNDLSPIEGHRINLYRRMVHPEYPSLCFVGLFDVSGGANIRMMDIQCKWLAAVIDGEIPLPGKPEMIREYEAAQQHMAKLYPNTPRYGLELDPREYGLALREDFQRARKQGQTAREAKQAS